MANIHTMDQHLSLLRYFLIITIFKLHNIMINNNTISRIYILTNPVLINDTTDFHTCLQFDKAGFQKHLLTSSVRLWLVTNWLFLNKKISLSKIIILWYFCLSFATFHSFVIARYSDISIDRNDFDAGFLSS